MYSPQEASNLASLQAFANCYLREVDGGRWYSAEAFHERTGLCWSSKVMHVVELALPIFSQTLALGMSYRSLVGRHTLCEVYRRAGSDDPFRRLDPLSVHLLLIDALYASAPERPERLELIGRVIESHQVMARYAKEATELGQTLPQLPPSEPTFIDSEQATIWGHWLHPTPKSRQSIATWQHEHYCPELHGRFQLHFFAAARHLVVQESIAEKPAEALIRTIATQGFDAGRVQRLLDSIGDVCLLPVHPLQADWLSHQPHVRRLLAQGVLTDLGHLGPLFTATSSVRTVYSEACEYMLKLSIPVKITNSLRINLRSELGDSVWISKLLQRCRIEENFSSVTILEDPASITIALPGLEETGFEVILRKNPFTSARQRRNVGEAHAVTALVADPIPGQKESLLERFVRSSAERLGAPLIEAAKSWFVAYLRCTIEPTLRIYDTFGIALEAHQQNSLIGFDHAHLPLRFYYRDIQGLALAESFRADLTRLVPELERQEKVFEPDDIVRSGLRYYLFSNHLYPVIYRLGLDGLCDEATLLGIVRQRLIEMRTTLSGPGRVLVDSLLSDPRIPCKANLLTRIEDLDELQAEQELAVYSMVENPLALVAPTAGRQDDGRPTSQSLLGLGAD